MRVLQPPPSPQHFTAPLFSFRSCWFLHLLSYQLLILPAVVSDLPAHVPPQRWQALEVATRISAMDTCSVCSAPGPASPAAEFVSGRRSPARIARSPPSKDVPSVPGALSAPIMYQEEGLDDTVQGNMRVKPIWAYRAGPRPGEPHVAVLLGLRLLCPCCSGAEDALGRAVQGKEGVLQGELEEALAHAADINLWCQWELWRYVEGKRAWFDFGNDYWGPVGDAGWAVDLTWLEEQGVEL